MTRHAKHSTISDNRSTRWFLTMCGSCFILCLALFSPHTERDNMCLSFGTILGLCVQFEYVTARTVFWDGWCKEADGKGMEVAQFFSFHITMKSMYTLQPATDQLPRKCIDPLQQNDAVIVGSQHDRTCNILAANEE